MVRLPDKPNWQPSQEDLQWLSGTLLLSAQGATVAIPADRLIYKVDHTNKILTLMTKPEDASAEETHRRMCIVARHLGWSVDSKKS